MSIYYEARLDLILDLSNDSELLNYIKEFKRWSDLSISTKDEDYNKVFSNFNFNPRYINYTDTYGIRGLSNVFLLEEDPYEFNIDYSNLNKVKLQCYVGNKNKDNNLERLFKLLLDKATDRNVIILYDETSYTKFTNVVKPDEEPWDEDMFKEFGLNRIFIPSKEIPNGFYSDPSKIETLFDSYEFNDTDIELYKELDIVDS